MATRSRPVRAVATPTTRPMTVAAANPTAARRMVVPIACQKLSSPS